MSCDLYIVYIVIQLRLPFLLILILTLLYEVNYVTNLCQATTAMHSIEIIFLYIFFNGAVFLLVYFDNFWLNKNLSISRNINFDIEPLTGRLRSFL